MELILLSSRLNVRSLLIFHLLILWSNLLSSLILRTSQLLKIREQVALSTCDELLDFLLNQGGSVGILDATNSTIERRQILFKHIKAREEKLGILFIESVCEDEKVRIHNPKEVQC